MKINIKEKFFIVLIFSIIFSPVYTTWAQNSSKQLERPEIFVMPHIQNQQQWGVASVPVINRQPCACAATVRCQPCGVIIPVPDPPCLCAPKPKCPACPPLSLIHDIASKKVYYILLIGLGFTRSKIGSKFEKFINKDN